MPRGEHPNSRKALEKNRAKTQFNGETAVVAAKKSQAVQAQGKRITQNLMEQSTPEMIQEANRRLLQAVKHGNLKAYEIWVAMMGEKPEDKVRVTAQANDMAKMDEILRQMDMCDEERDTLSAI